MSFEDELKQFMDEVEVKELGLDAPDLVIQDMNSAYYFIQKLQELKEEQKQINDVAKTELERKTQLINEWKQKETNRIDYLYSYYLSLLQPYIESVLDGKKTIKTPYGTIGYRKQPNKYSYDDEIVLEYLKQKGSDLVTEEIVFKYNKTDLKKAGEIKDGKLYIDGEELPGITVEELPDKFDVR